MPNLWDAKKGCTHMVFLIVCLIIGCGVGLRFKVLALVPVTILLVLFLIFSRSSGGDAFWSVFMTLAASLSLQIGYLIGLCIHYLVLQASPTASRLNSVSGASPSRTGQ